MRRKIYTVVLLVVLGFAGCIKYDYFGLDTTAEIMIFNIQGQVSNKITTDGGPDGGGLIRIGMPGSFDFGDLKVLEVQNTQLSYFDIDPYSVKDFSEPVTFTLTAEDTAVKKKWQVIVTNSDVPRQLPFSGMKEWRQTEHAYTEDGVKKYAYFPGRDGEFSPWQHAARANSITLSGINTMTAYPMPYAEDADYARMETIFIKKGLLVTAGATVVTGALFSGNFVFDISFAPVIGSSEPRKMLDIGTPFYRRPAAARFKMRYLPGKEMMQGTGTPVKPGEWPSKDSCDIYCILQDRLSTPGTYTRVGAAHLRTGEAVGDIHNDANGFVEVTVPFIYGRPDAAVLAEKPYLNINNEGYGGSVGEILFYDFSKKIDKNTKPVKEVFAENPLMNPDHISVMFSSSAHGDRFFGAVNGDLNVEKPSPRGSILDIKDFELLYDDL